MNNQVKELLLEGYSQRAIARKLEIDRRTVAKYDKIMASSVYYKRIRKLVHSSSGFDTAKEFIAAKLTIKPEIGKRQLYRQVIKRYPEITLGERAFNYYIDNFKSRQDAYKKIKRYSEPASSWKKRLDKVSKVLKQNNTFDEKGSDLAVGEKIKLYRNILGLSKKVLAENIGVTPPMITYYEQGKRRPSLRTITKLAKFTQIPVEYYLTVKKYHSGEVNSPIDRSKVDAVDPGVTENSVIKVPNKKTKNEVVKEVKKLITKADSLVTSSPEQSIEISKKVLKIAEENNYNLGIGLAYKNLGVGYSYQGDNHQALKNFLNAEAKFNEEQHYEGLRTTYNNIGAVYNNWNDLEKALEYYQKNLKLEEYFSDFGATCVILNNMGLLYHKLAENEKALKYCQEALAISLKHNLKMDTSFTLNNIGSIYHALNEPKKSEKYLKKAIAISRDINNTSGQCRASVNLSKWKSDLNQFDEALSLLKAALECARKLKDKYWVSKSYLQFAETYKRMGKTNKQKEYLQKSIALAEPNKFRSMSLSAYIMLSDFYEDKSDFFNALKCFKKIQKIKDFLNDEKRTRGIEEIKTRMEVERTEKEKEILRQNNTELQQKNEQIIRQKEKLEKAEEQLTELNHNLELKVKKEVKKRRQQEQIIMQKSKLESLGRLAAGIAHEINQPVGLIHMAAQNLCHKFENNKITAAYLTKKTNFIYENIDRINKIIEHLRLFSRDQKRRKEKVDVVKTLEDSFSLITTQFRNHNINIIKDIKSEIPLTAGNKYQLEQVLINLLSNAKDALDSKHGKYGKGKQINLRVNSNGKKINIEIEDNGCGIAKKTARRIFDPFFTSKKESEGTGLGLSISYGIIKDMNGKITVDSEKGKFTLFKIELPCHGE